MFDGLRAGLQAGLQESTGCTNYFVYASRENLVWQGLCMSNISDQAKRTIYSNTLARRNFFIRPPEPPEELLMGDPANSIYIGRTKIFHVPFHWSYKNVTNPHIAIVGISGAGKSYFVKTFLTRASFVWGANAFIIDWAGEYRDWVKQTGGKVLALGKGSYINLLDLAGMKPLDRVKQVIRTLEILTDLGQYPEQRRLTELSIEEAYVRKGFKMADKLQRDALGNLIAPPTLKDAQRILEERLDAGTYEFPAELENAIFRVKKFTREGEDFFAEQSTIKLDELTNIGLVDLDLSGLPDEVFRGLAALSMLQFLKEKMREEGWSPTKGLKLLVILDEAWKVAKEDNSDAVMIVREGRKYQFGLIVASQNPTDISESIFSNVGTTFILRIKFEKYMDYIQNSLNFSEYMRESIGRFGVGECAVNMAFQTATPFAETFLLDKIEGEEPLIEYFLDIASVFGLGAGVEQLAKTYSFERTELKRRLRGFGLGDANVEEITGLFDKRNRHMDVINFVILLEKYGIARSNITQFLKDVGLEDATIINVFAKSDQKKLGMEDKDITEVILKEERKPK